MAHVLPMRFMTHVHHYLVALQQVLSHEAHWVHKSIQQQPLITGS